MQKGSSFTDGRRRRAIAKSKTNCQNLLDHGLLSSPLIMATMKMSIIRATNRLTSIWYRSLLSNMYVKAMRPTSQTIPWQVHSRNLQCVLKLLICTKLRRKETDFFVNSTSRFKIFFRNTGTTRFSPSSLVSELI